MEFVVADIELDESGGAYNQSGEWEREEEGVGEGGSHPGQPSQRTADMAELADDDLVGLRCVAPHVRCLRRAGFWRAAGGGRRARLHALYRAAVLALTAAYLLQECVYACQVRGHMQELARVLFLLLCHVTSLVKQLALAARGGRLRALLAALRAVSGGAAHAQLRRRTERRAARLQRAFAGTAALTCALWLLLPLARRARGGRVTFPLWLPGDAHAPPRFALALLYQFAVTTLVGVANTTVDAFIATVLYQCHTQLRILRLNLESLMERAEDTSKRTKEDLEQVAMRLFLECLDHYEKIIRTVNMLEDMFGDAILIQFGVGGWILCMAVYKLVSLSILSIEFASMALFIFCILLELFLYCYFGNEVTFESERLAQSVFASGWWRGGRRRARAVLLALTRVARALRPAAMRLVPLSLATFLQIIKSSYTFYAVLRQTKEK